MSRESISLEPVCWLNVQPPVASGVAQSLLSRRDLLAYYQSLQARGTAKARRPIGAEMRKRAQAEAIIRYDRERGCSLIAMGIRGMGSVAYLLLGSVAREVISVGGSACPAGQVAPPARRRSSINSARQRRQ